MKINIKSTGIELTEAISDYVYKRVSTIEKFLGEQQDVVAQVEVGKTTQHHKNGEVFKAEINLTGEGLNLYAVTEQEDLYRAIDKVKDDVAREIRRSKGKQFALARKGQAMMKSIMKGFPWNRK